MESKGSLQLAGVLREVKKKLQQKSDKEQIAEKCGYKNFAIMEQTLNNSIANKSINGAKLVKICKIAKIKMAEIFEELGL